MNLKLPSFHFDQNLREVPDNHQEWLTLIEASILKIQTAESDEEKLILFETLALAFRITNQLTEAERYQVEALALSNTPIKKIQNLTRLAIIYQWQKKFAEAKELYSQVLILITNNDTSKILVAAYHQHLGKLYFDQEQYNSSIKEFEIALKIRIEINAPLDQVESSRLALNEAQSRNSGEINE